MTLICAKFDDDLINISNVTSRKTMWPRLLLAYPVYKKEIQLTSTLISIKCMHDIKSISYEQ